MAGIAIYSSTACPGRINHLIAQRKRGFVRRRAALLLVLAILLSGLLGGLPARPAQAQSTSAAVTVRLTIDRVMAINGFEGLIGKADFYPLIHLNGGAEQTRDAIVDDDDLDAPPVDWHFDTDVTIDTRRSPISSLRSSSMAPSVFFGTPRIAQRTTYDEHPFATDGCRGQ